MFRPVIPLSEKDMEGTVVESMDEEDDEEMVDVYPTRTEAKRQRVFGGEMDSFLPNAVLTCDYVPDIGLASEVGRAAGGLNLSGGVEEKIPTMLGWRCDDGGMDLVLPNAVPDIVPNNGHLLDRRAGSSHPRGGVKEFTPAFEEANSPKVLKSMKKAWRSVMHPFLRNDKVETLIPSELNADSDNPNLKDDAGLASSKLKTVIKPDKQRKALFGCPWRGKVESMPTPQLKADPAIPDVREVVDLASQSKADVGPKKQKEKASKSRKSNLQGEKVTVVPTQQPKAISDIPVGMDVPALAGPQSKTKIRPDKSKTLKQRIFGCFWRGKVESMPTSQIEADPADLADSQSKSVGLKKQKQKASKSRFFHNPWRKKGKSKVKKDADPAIPDAMDGADLASFGGTAAANARLQKIGAIPKNIGLKGGGNPDPNKAKSPGPKEDENPGAKAIENPRHSGAEDDRVVRPKVVDLFQKVFKPPEETKPADPPVPKETFDSKYTFFNEVIGKGYFGKVFKGIRKSDGCRVAIKRISKRKDERTLQIPGYPKPVITEVALMLKLRDAPSCPNVIQFYDWYETEDFYTLALEYPQHCQTLWDFVSCERHLSENIARHLMRQAVLAVKHCLDNGVFHTDLHGKNFLVQKSTMTLKLIDFGLGYYLTDEAYDSHDFIGAQGCIPPEMQMEEKYYPMPANVWALGALLYFMVLGTSPCPIDPFYGKGLSKEICDLMKRCLAMNPRYRPTLKQILDHDWFKTESNEEELFIYKMRALST
ncbi:uncharacterized protein [Misgurnus anguillicaudatus]|uniref:uncharacterized protein n=1 Tax=Misgurnus anguillicaudatus TaxID=75329 RepID=UPI003CCF6836